MKKKILLALPILLFIYLTGLTLKYLQSRYNHDAYLKSLPNIREICLKQNKDNFKLYVQCLDSQSDKNEQTKDPTARALMVMPKANYDRKYVMQISTESGWKESKIETAIEDGIVSIDFKHLLELLPKEEMEGIDFSGLAHYIHNENFGEVNIDLENENIISKLLVRPFSNEGFISFKLNTRWLIIKSDGVTNQEVEKIINN